MEKRRPRLLFVVNVDWFFLSHRLPIARAAREQGLEVIVAAADSGKAEVIRQAGFEFIPLPLQRKSTGPFGEARTFAFLVGLYKRLRPDLVHHVTIKPVLYGSIAARIAGVGAIVNAVSGLGYAFTTESRASLLRRLVTMLYRLALNNQRAHTIFQNPDDRGVLIGLGLIKEQQTVLIRGAGVNCNDFVPVPEPGGVPIAMLPARMLWDKGVKEFVEAARLLRAAGSSARFVLVGGSDEGNPTAVPHEQLAQWQSEGIIEWWGQRDDMPQLLAGAHLVVLPSYREGLPKVLLEAAACARAIVATDVPGCREIVRPGVNGLLVPAKDPVALASAIHELLDSADLRRQFGAAGRQMVLSEFAEELVVEQTLDLYANLLGDRWSGSAKGAVLS